MDSSDENRQLSSLGYEALSRIAFRYYVYAGICRLQSSPRLAGFSIFRFTREQKDSGWVNIKCMPVNYRLTGWKFHFSIHSEDMVKAIKCFINLHVNGKLDHIPCSKFLPFDKLQTSDTRKQNDYGKEIVLHLTTSAIPEEWMSVLTIIETSFRALNIRSGQKLPKGDRIVPGSLYLGYRNDQDLEGKYIVSANNYNPLGKPDPYFHFGIEVNYQKRAETEGRLTDWFKRRKLTAPFENDNGPPAINSCPEAEGRDLELN